jgi:hypothetical protein
MSNINIVAVAVAALAMDAQSNLGIMVCPPKSLFNNVLPLGHCTFCYCLELSLAGMNI